MQKEIMTKTSLSQKINKLYSEDSKELVMFYPVSKTENSDNKDKSHSGFPAGQGSTNSPFNATELNGAV